MPPYLLDYTDQPVTDYPPKPAVRTQVLFTTGCILVFSISLAGNFFYHSQYQNLRKVARGQALQYDSLLSAKRYADRQAADLRNQLMQLQQQPLRTSPTTLNFPTP